MKAYNRGPKYLAKSAKTKRNGEDQKTLVSTLVEFLTAFMKSFILVYTNVCSEAILKFPQYLAQNFLIQDPFYL